MSNKSESETNIYVGEEFRTGTNQKGKWGAFKLSPKGEIGGNFALRQDSDIKEENVEEYLGALLSIAVLEASEGRDSEGKKLNPSRTILRMRVADASERRQYAERKADYERRQVS